MPISNVDFLRSQRRWKELKFEELRPVDVVALVRDEKGWIVDNLKSYHDCFLATRLLDKYARGVKCAKSAAPDKVAKELTKVLGGTIAIKEAPSCEGYIFVHTPEPKNKKEKKDGKTKRTKNK